MEIYNLFETKQSNVSLAQVIVFDDSQTVVKWEGKIRSLVIHKSLDEFKSVSLNGERYLSRIN